MFKRISLGIAIAICVSYTTAAYAACTPYTYTFTNGTTGDASQVQGNFTTIMNCANTLAPLASPALTGTPTAPTQSAGDNSTKLATTAFVASAIAAPGNGGFCYRTSNGNCTTSASTTATSVFKLTLRGIGGNGGVGGNGSTNIGGGGGGGQAGMCVLFISGLTGANNAVLTLGAHGVNTTVVLGGITLTATPGGDGAAAGAYGTNGGGQGGSGGNCSASAGTVIQLGGFPGTFGGNGIAAVYAGAGGNGGGPGGAVGVLSGAAGAATAPGAGGAGSNGGGSGGSNGVAGDFLMEQVL